MDEYIPAAVEDAPPVVVPGRREPPRYKKPLILFLLTCLTTFLCGSAWTEILPSGVRMHYFDAANGLRYMLTLMAILTAHELGHFLQALRHGVHASLPYFIPMPIGPIGTMGAVIAMRGGEANRKQLFDIGLTGPIAGLLVAVPVAWYGIKVAVPAEYVPPDIDLFHDPLLFQWFIRHLHPNLPLDTVFAPNPFYQAAWVGMLITGLNMLPISQLDGGHTAYALFGRKAYWLARAVVAGILAAMVISGHYEFIVMVVLVMFMGVDHPPTSNDQMPLGPVRYAIGLASLLIPILCLAPVPIG